MISTTPPAANPQNRRFSTTRPHTCWRWARENGGGQSKVLVPNVVGLEWIEARDVLGRNGLVAINAQPDAPTDPESRGWVITDQSPESGARVPAGSVVRLWLRGEGDSGVREPRRPRPTPRSARERLPEPRDQAIG